MMTWMGEELKGLGASIEYVDIGSQTLPDGQVLKLPPVLMGELGQDPAKKTLLVYGHLDVQPANEKEDGWDTDPWVLTEKDGKLYGRGSTDDKGPVLGWIHALQAYREIGQEVPVNFKFCFGGTVHEGMVDLMWMMNQLVDGEGNILVEGLMDSVAPLTAEESAKYDNIDFDVDVYRTDLGAPGHLMHKDDKKKTLMARWRYPSLSLHGIQGAFSDAGAKTVIPRKVIGKFSVRIVPDQTPEGVEK